MLEEYAQNTGEAIVIGDEASLATLPGTPTGSIVPVTSCTLTPEVTTFTPESNTGTAETRGTEQGKKKVAVDVELECNPSSVIPLLSAVFRGTRKHGTAALWTRDWYLQPGKFSNFVEQGHTDFAKYNYALGCVFGGLSMDLAAEGFMKAKFTAMGALMSTTKSTSLVAPENLTDRRNFRPFSYLRIRVLQGGLVMGISKKITFGVDRKVGSDVAQDETDSQSVIFTNPAMNTGNMEAQFATNAVSGYSAADLRDMTLDPDNQTSIEVFIPYGKGWGLWVRCPAVKFKPGAVKTQAGNIATFTADFDLQPYGSLLPELRTIWFTNLGASLVTKVLNIHTNEEHGGGGAGNHTVTFGATAGDYDTPQKVADFIHAHAATVDVAVERKFGETGACLVLRPSPAAVGDDAGATDIRIATTGSDAAAVLGLETTDDTAAKISAIQNRSIIITGMSAVAA